MASSWYVKRERPADGRVGWVGPIRSARQAAREAGAWRDAGWCAYAMPTCPLVRAEVRSWEKAKRSS